MMNPSPRAPVAAVLLGMAVLFSGCSQQGGTPAPDATQRQAQADNADAARNLDTYRQLLRINNDEMAVSMGKEIIRKYPASEAAKEVQKTLPAIEKRYIEVSAKNRLAALWLYQVSPMQGGTQSTATIESSQASGGVPVRLVLRRHTSWGQNVFLYGSGHGFVCRGNCTIASTVDGKPVGIKAFAPSTGEPALMIRDDKGFIAMLRKAGKISMAVTTVDGEKKQTLVYEVGGFEPAKWTSPGKSTRRQSSGRP